MFFLYVEDDRILLLNFKRRQILLTRIVLQLHTHTHTHDWTHCGLAVVVGGHGVMVVVRAQWHTNYLPTWPPLSFCLFKKTVQLDGQTIQLRLAAGISQWHFIYNMTRVRRVDQQNDGGGLVVVETQKHLLQNVSGANRELDNVN